MGRLQPAEVGPDPNDCSAEDRAQTGEAAAGGTQRASKSNVSNLFSGVAPYQAALDYHLERHNVLASNVAHVDTPGYVPKDIERAQGFASVMNVAMTATSEGHLAGIAPKIDTGHVFDDPTAGGGNDKNFVSLDREAAKLAANQIRYDVNTALAASELATLAYVAGDGKG